MRYSICRAALAAGFIFAGTVLGGLAYAQSSSGAGSVVCVEGVIIDNRGPLAIVNGDGVREGDSVAGVLVRTISENEVEFEHAGQVFTKRIGDPCSAARSMGSVPPEPAELLGQFKDDFMRMRASEGHSGQIEEMLIASLAEHPEQFIGIMFLIVFAFYVYTAVTLQVIARKSATENGWLAWIPIANLYLMCMIAGKPAWWLILLFIPYVNIIIMAIVWMGIAEARDKPSWVGLLTLLPVINFFVFGYLAFSE